MDIQYTAAFKTSDIAFLEKGEEAPAGLGITLLNGPGKILGPEHAVHEEATLCGIPKDEVMLVRHYFQPAGKNACDNCRRIVEREGS